jgi:hypothetical protein
VVVGDAAVIAGVALIGVVLVDMGLTVLHPTIRGPVSHRLTRVVWRLSRAVALASGRRMVLEFAGPLVVVSLLVAWIAGLWLGFGLVLLPSIGDFASSVRVGHGGLLAALYASATNLTTLGIGDLLPASAGARMVVAAEALAGVATMSAAISYVLSVYPLATQTRAYALLLSDLGLRTPEGALAYLRATGDSGLADIHERLINGHQSLRRFSVLYYFDPGQDRESVGRMLETASVLCAIARWAPPRELTAYGHHVAHGLQATLTRIRRDYEGRYIGGETGAPSCSTMSDAAARDLLHALRRLISGEDALPPEDGGARAFAAFVQDMDELLQGYARSHLMDHQPLARRLAPTAQPAHQ